MENSLKICVGDIVENIHTGDYGTVRYSTFGLSIHMWNEEYGALGKTSGEPVETVALSWKVITLPEGYERYKYGGLRKKGDAKS